jgi:hypothetical protein
MAAGRVHRRYTADRVTITSSIRRASLWLSRACILVSMGSALGCAATPPMAVAPEERDVTEATTEAVHIERGLEVQGFMEALAGGYMVGVRVRNVGPSDRVVLTGESALRAATFVDSEGEETLRLGTADDAPPADTSCMPMDGVLLRSGEELRLTRAFEESVPQVAARGEFELHVTRPGGVRPIIVRRVRFEVPLTGAAPELGGPMAPLPVDANAAGLVVQEPVVLVSAEHVYFAGVRLANRGSAPVVVPLFGLLHAAADFGEGDMFPLIGRGTSFGCPHCGPGLGPSVCDYLEGVLLSPGEAITLVADLELDAAPPPGPARVAYLLDAYPLGCGGVALNMSGNFTAEPQPLQ